MAGLESSHSGLAPVQGSTQHRQHTQDELSFSAVVVCYNEAHLMRQCLESLEFCDEIIVVDVGSTDGSQDLAEKLGAKLLQHDHNRVPNLARQFGIAQAQHEWVFTIDMDEVFPKEEYRVIEEVIRSHPDVNMIRVPIQYFFRGKKLTCTRYGRPGRTRWTVVYRDRAVGTPYAHQEFRLDQAVHHVPWSAMSPIKHYWRESYKEVIQKLWSHLPVDGESFYASGKRFSRYNMARAVAAEMKANFVYYRGFRGGFDCLLLSLIRVVYVALAWMSLRRYERILRLGETSRP